MKTSQSHRAFEPTIPRAVWKHRWLVLAAVVVGGYLGAIYSASEATNWAATASLIVEDPRASAVFELGVAQRPERYAENQVKIIGSAVVAEKASEILFENVPSYSIDAHEIQKASSVRGRIDSDLITIRFTSNQADLARRGANTLAVAYQEVRRSEAARNYATALLQLENSIEAAQSELTMIQSRISDLMVTPSRDQLNAQYESALSELVALQNRVLTDDLAAGALEELTRLQDQFARLQLVIGIESQNPEFGALLEEQAEAIRRISVLIARRDQLKVDSEIAGSGVVFFSPASAIKPAGISMSQAVSSQIAPSPNWSSVCLCSPMSPTSTMRHSGVSSPSSNLRLLFRPKHSVSSRQRSMALLPMGASRPP